MKVKETEERKEDHIERKAMQSIAKEKEERKEKAKQVEESIMKRVYHLILVAIVVLAYFFGMNLVSSQLEITKIVSILEIIAIGLLLGGLLGLEIAYRKDSGKIMIKAIESLVLAAHAVSAYYVVTRFHFDFKIYLLTSSYVFALYFISKAVVIYTKGKRDYFNSLSDISELVKKEEPNIKEATKKKKDIHEPDNIETENDIKSNPTKKKTTTKKSTSTTAKKKTVTKKETEKEKAKEEKTETKQVKRTKKSKTVKDKEPKNTKETPEEKKEMKNKKLVETKKEEKKEQKEVSDGSKKGRKKKEEKEND